MERIRFCGVIEGSVVVRKGESEADALQRASETINSVLSRYCRNLGDKVSRTGEDAIGPIVGLEKWV